MKNLSSVKIKRSTSLKKGHFDPFKLVLDEEFCKNMNAIIAYYQISKGEAKQRFVSSY